MPTEADTRRAKELFQDWLDHAPANELEARRYMEIQLATALAAQREIRDKEIRAIINEKGVSASAKLNRIICAIRHEKQDG